MKVEDFVFNSEIELSYEDKVPYYYYSISNGETDFEEITIPEKTKNITIPVLHELAHATGTPERLARASLYELTAHEEILAEMSAVLVATSYNFKFSIKKSISYIVKWIVAEKIPYKEESLKIANWISSNWGDGREIKFLKELDFLGE